jgi:hypothetical protein
MKKVLLVALLLGMVSTEGAQTSNTGAPGASECKLKLAQAPVIRGIRLGMSVKKVLAVFPGAEKDEALRQRLLQSNFGLISFAVQQANYASKERFFGVQFVNFTFLDGELNRFDVAYNGPEWKTRNQFVLRVVEAFNLPGVELWKEADTHSKLTCDGFAVLVVINSIGVTSLAKDAHKIVREREEAVKEEARRAFKP